MNQKNFCAIFNRGHIKIRCNQLNLCLNETIPKTTLLAVKKNKSICIDADTLTVIAGGRKQTSADLVNSDKIIKYEANYIGVFENHSLLLA